jgi:hypothetical protein
VNVTELIALLQEDARPGYTADVRVPDCPRCGLHGDDSDITGATVIPSPGPGEGDGWITLHMEAGQ